MKDVAFIVSCADYEDEAIKNLKYPTEDAKKIKEVFEKKIGVSDIRCLTSTEYGRIPTRSRVIRELRPKSMEEPIQLLFFYYSGHGFQSGASKKDYIAVSDSIASDLEDTSLSLEKICGLLKEFNAEQVILWIDACKTVQNGSSKGTVEFNLEAGYLNGLTIFYSCSEGEESFENDKIQMSLFTYTLCQAFQSQSCRIIRELNEYLVKEVPQNCERYGVPRQHPFIQIRPLEAEKVYLVKNSAKWFHEVRKPVPYGGYSLPEGTVLGIDFGTSYTVVAAASDNQFYSSRDGNNKTLIPTIISIDREFGYYIGTPPEGKEVLTIRGIKRLIGVKDSIKINGLEVRIEYLISFILGSVIKNAEEFFGMSFELVSMAKPIVISKNEESVLREAIRLTGKQLTRLFSESDCVAVNEDAEKKMSFLVIDFGGGTCDISFVEAGDGVFEILFSVGDVRLGGIDFDNCIEEYLTKKVKAVEPGIVLDEIVYRQLREEAERIKISLGSSDSTSAFIRNVETFAGELINIEISITRELFLKICEPTIQSLKNLLAKAVEEVKLLEPYPLMNFIILSGQTAQCFFVKNLIKEFFPSQECVLRNFYGAVVQGLAVYSQKLTYAKCANLDKLLLMVTTYGIEIPCREILEDALLIHNYRDEEYEWFDKDGIKIPQIKTVIKDLKLSALVISSEAEENSLAYPLLKLNTTIPTKQKIGIRGASASLLCLVIYTGDGRKENLRSVAIEGDILLILEMDANREIVIKIYDCNYQMLETLTV